MFIVTLTYLKPIEVVEKYLAEHRAFLEIYYQKDLLIASGPKNPRDGGIIISNHKDREQLETFLKQDPFYVNQIAKFDIVEFTPVKFHEKFNYFIAKDV